MNTLESLEFLKVRFIDCGISASTIKSYIQSVKRYLKLNHKGDDDIDINDLLNNYEEILDKLKIYKHLGSKKGHLSSWIKCAVVCEHEQAENAFRGEFMIVRLKIKEEMATNDKTKKKENWVSFNELKGVYRLQKSRLKNLNIKAKNRKDEELPKSHMNILKHTLIMALYLSDIEINPPRRINDYQNCYVFDKFPHRIKGRPFENSNFLITQCGKYEFIFRNYKTYKAHGEVKSYLNNELRVLMRLYLYWKSNDSNWLFPNKDNTGPITSSQFSAMLSGIFKQYFPDKNISVNMLRNIIFSHKYKDVPSMENFREYAAKCGTSVQTIFDYYKMEVGSEGNPI
jgi:hypothetical protein